MAPSPESSASCYRIEPATIAGVVGADVLLTLIIVVITYKIASSRQKRIKTGGAWDLSSIGWNFISLNVRSGFSPCSWQYLYEHPGQIQQKWQTTAKTVSNCRRRGQEVKREYKNSLFLSRITPYLQIWDCSMTSSVSPVTFQLYF